MSPNRRCEPRQHYDALDHRFSPYFVEHFMTPLVAAAWSCAPGDALRYPARYQFEFLEHHRMLTVLASPTWRTVVGGSATYVNAIAAGLGDRPAQTFDAAVIATHPDQALSLLEAPTAAERRVMGAIPYSSNSAALHTDTLVLPRHPRARASWNCPVTSDTENVLVTCDVSALMWLRGEESVAAQQLLGTIDDGRVVFASAYHGCGFHEDGAAAGLRAANSFGAEWLAKTTQTGEVLAC